MKIIHTHKSIGLILIFIAIFAFGYIATDALAQSSESTLYVPIIGITSVPEPLALPEGAGNVTYRYAVKNFIEEVALTNVRVTDAKCSPIKFVTGDDNSDSKLDHNETWRYTCIAKISATTESTATATGNANNITATHRAYTTVVVESNSPPPLVSIVNITKIAYPLSLPTEGGSITFTYKVSNPGIVPLSDVTVEDNKCNTMSGKLGDINSNNLLDISEVWIYTCTTALTITTTNTVTVTAFANGLKATNDAILTVVVDTPPNLPDFSIPSFPETGALTKFKIATWGILSGGLVSLVITFLLTRKGKTRKTLKK